MLSHLLTGEQVYHKISDVWPSLRCYNSPLSLVYQIRRWLYCLFRVVYQVRYKLFYMELVFDWHKATLLGNTKHHLIKVSKCKFMLLGHSSHLGDFSSLSLSISGEDLERVDCYKYLGFTPNQRLSWEDHVSNIASKIRKRISILSRIKYMLPLSARLTFYKPWSSPFLNTIIFCGETKEIQFTWTLFKYFKTELRR